MMNDITLYDMYMSIMIIFTAKAMVINRIVAFRFLIRRKNVTNVAEPIIPHSVRIRNHPPSKALPKAPEPTPNSTNNGDDRKSLIA